jgi:hypothetical protein
MLNMLNEVIAKKYDVDYLDQMYTSMYESQTNKACRLSKDTIKDLMQANLKNVLMNEIIKYDSLQE